MYDPLLFFIKVIPNFVRVSYELEKMCNFSKFQGSHTSVNLIHKLTSTHFYLIPE